MRALHPRSRGICTEAKEVLAGYSLRETAALDEAVEISQTCPGVDRGWVVIEVRPVTAQRRRSSGGG